MKIRMLLYISFLISWSSLMGCTKTSETENRITVSHNEIVMPAEGGTASFLLETDADSWNINGPASDWLTLSANSGTQKSVEIMLTVASKSIEERIDTLTISAGNAKPVKVIVSQIASEFLYTLSASIADGSFIGKGGTSTITVNTTASQWTVECEQSWITNTPTNGSQSDTAIFVTVLANNLQSARTGSIYIKAPYAPTDSVIITQEGSMYPGYNLNPIEPDESGMTSTAAELAAKISLGWNLGNSLEATGGETSWGNPKTTQALIDLVKQSGFNAVRIPCSWNGHLSNSAKAEISSAWLARVKEVIQYCANNNMYVILNIHWDGGWLENNCTKAKQEENNAKQKAFWEQIATYLRDFDEHVLFASANEPNVSNATEMSVLTSYHQTFVDAVRSTGGKNSYRTLVIQGPSTDIEKTNKLMTTLPTDNVPNKMMVEIHYYTPWNFCGLEADADWGKMFYYWGEGYHQATDPDHNATWGEESTVRSNFNLMKTKFVDKGIPVLMGEFSVLRRSSLTGDALTAHLASRAYYFNYVVQQAKIYGLLPFYWDNGGTGNNGCALFNRFNNSVADQQALDALLDGAQ